MYRKRYKSCRTPESELGITTVIDDDGDDVEILIAKYQQTRTSQSRMK